MKKMEIKRIAFICNKEKCNICNSVCTHTFDYDFAKNKGYYDENGIYVSKDMIFRAFTVDGSSISFIEIEPDKVKTGLIGLEDKWRKTFSFYGLSHEEEENE